MLDGAWYEQNGELIWQGLGHLKTSEVGAVLESTVRRFERHLRRHGLLRTDEDDRGPDAPDDPEGNLAASAVSGQAPPAGPQWVVPLARLEPHALAWDKPLWPKARLRAAPRWTGSRCMRLAMITEPASVVRYLAATGEATEVPSRSPGRGPPYGKSRVLRRRPR